jgi:hypothetical protein
MRGVLGRLTPWLRCQNVAALDERSVRIPCQPRSNDFRARSGRSPIQLTAVLLRLYAFKYRLSFVLEHRPANFDPMGSIGEHVGAALE